MPTFRNQMWVKFELSFVGLPTSPNSGKGPNSESIQAFDPGPLLEVLMTSRRGSG